MFRCLMEYSQPPSGGCVLKPVMNWILLRVQFQPPSGGCVLKLEPFAEATLAYAQPPSGGCVLKQNPDVLSVFPKLPAAFGRLCVETLVHYLVYPSSIPSRLRAAVC